MKQSLHVNTVSKYCKTTCKIGGVNVYGPVNLKDTARVLKSTDLTHRIAWFCCVCKEKKAQLVLGLCKQVMSELIFFFFWGRPLDQQVSFLTFELRQHQCASSATPYDVNAVISSVTVCCVSIHFRLFFLNMMVTITTLHYLLCIGYSMTCFL